MAARSFDERFLSAYRDNDVSSDEDDSGQEIEEKEHNISQYGGEDNDLMLYSDHGLDDDASIGLLDGAGTGLLSNQHVAGANGSAPTEGKKKKKSKGGRERTDSTRGSRTGRRGSLPDYSAIYGDERQPRAGSFSETFVSKAGQSFDNAMDLTQRFGAETKEVFKGQKTLPALYDSMTFRRFGGRRLGMNLSSTTYRLTLLIY